MRHLFNRWWRNRLSGSLDGWRLVRRRALVGNAMRRRFLLMVDGQ
jgi:hypothetical protein